MQLFDFAADVSLWAVLLSLFGMDRERSWGRWTLGFVAVYFAAHVVDIITLFFWEYEGKAVVLLPIRWLAAAAEEPAKARANLTGQIATV
jgi:hypothetical protein